MSETTAETAETAPDYSTDHDRDEVADDLRDAMDEALRKFTKGRVYDEDAERIRIKWLRSYVAAATEYRQQVDDLEEEQREERIEALEARLSAVETAAADAEPEDSG